MPSNRPLMAIAAIFPDRVVPMLPEECPLILCSFARSVYHASLPGTGGMIFGRPWPQRAPFLRGVIRSAGAGGDLDQQAQRPSIGQPWPTISAVARNSVGMCGGDINRGS